MNFLEGVPLSSLPLSGLEILLSISLAFLLGLIIVGVYRLTNRSSPPSPSFYLTLILLSMVVSMVMMVIGNSIARAFSLVGALSIIRFRTVVKDNRDIAYVFFALAAGMACGVSNYPLALYGVGLISLMLMLLDYIRFGHSRNGIYVLRLQVLPQDTSMSEMRRVMDAHLSSSRQLSVKTIRMGEFVQYTYIVRLKNDEKLQQFISALTAIEGVDRVSLIADDEEPEGA